jgi:hypothetical protein
LISHKHHTIFVHIPKVAGQSIEMLFLKDQGLDWSSREALLLRPKRKGEQGPERLAHLTARQYVDLGYTDQKTFEQYFTFAFVRNPYKRLLSFYHYLGYASVISVDTFIDEVLPKKLQSADFFFLAQYDYLYDQGKLLVDFVGKLENIGQDIKTIYREAGIQNSQLPHVNKSGKGQKRGLAALIKQPGLIRHFRPGNLMGRQTIALNPSQKDRIFRHYQNDFEAFGYEK